MKIKSIILAFLLSFPIILLGQHSISTEKSENEIEYEQTRNCLSNYHKDLESVFELSGLQEDELYTIDITHPDNLDNLEDIDMSLNPENWDLETSYSQYSKRYYWRGSDWGQDYLSIGVYIENEDVEVGLSQTFSASISQPGSTATAFSSVEVITSSTVNGAFLDCSNPVSYTITDLGAEGSAAWVIKQNGSTKAFGTGTTATASNISTGAAEVEFTVSFDCEDLEPLTFSKDFWFGIFQSTVVTGTTAVCPDTYYTYTAQVPGGHDDDYSYTWAYPSNWIWPTQSDNTLRIKTPLYNPNYGTVTVSIENDCGTSNYSGITVYPGYCGGYYMASPTPSSNYVDIDIKEDQVALRKICSEQSIVIKVVDKMGTAKHTAEFKGKGFPYRIDTNLLPEGNYVVQILNGIYTESLQVLVKH